MTHFNKTKYLGIAIAISLFTASCKKDKTEKPIVEPETGVLVLAEGGFGTPNSTLSYYVFKTGTVVADVFSAQNGRVLGDTGNEIKQYGSKIYIAMDRSGTVEVINTNGKSVKQIELKNAGVTRGPRDFAFHNGKVYISCYEGNVAVLDTVSLNIETFISVGRNPDQLGIANGKLYVANSGGIPGDENTVTVIDLTTNAKKNIIVGDNPYGIAVDNDNEVYVTAFGKWGVSPSSLTIINSITDEVKSKIDFNGGAFIISGTKGYFVGYDNKVKVYDTQTEVIINEDFISDGTTLKAPYVIALNEATGQVFVTDALTYDVDGDCYAFDSTGKKLYSFKTGINPGSILFVNK